jgi:hypothetical protein
MALNISNSATSGVVFALGQDEFGITNISVVTGFNVTNDSILFTSPAQTAITATITLLAQVGSADPILQLTGYTTTGAMPRVTYSSTTGNKQTNFDQTGQCELTNFAKSTN